MSGRAPENPYLAARLEWNERYHGFLRAKRNWQILAIVLVGVNAGLGGALAWAATQSRVVPYVVEVDRLRQALAIGPAERSRASDAALLRYQLIEFIRRTRSVVSDGAAEKQLLDAAYSQASGSAVQFLNEHFQVKSPFVVMRERTVSVQVTTVLQLPASDSWQIQWIETQRGLDGAVHKQERWQALLRAEVRAPESEEELLRNPLGFYVTDIQWTQQL